MPTHRVMARILLTAASLTAAGLMLHSAPASAAPAINSCGTMKSVTPSTLKAALAGNGCKTLVMSAGSYSAFSISSHSGGVLTLRCVSKGACKFASNNRAQNVDGLIIDGIQVSGGSNGIYIRGKNIKVQNSTFIEQSSSGVTVLPGARSDNVQIYNNEFRNSRRGCQYNTSNCSGNLTDGTPVAYMDYGLRVHDTNYVEIKNNKFSTLFNHGISIKYNVTTSLIDGNTFSACGRNCIDLGQATPASNTATVSSNYFGPSRTHAVAIRYMRRSLIINNSFVSNGMLNVKQFVRYGTVEGQK